MKITLQPRMALVLLSASPLLMASTVMSGSDNYCQSIPTAEKLRTSSSQIIVVKGLGGFKATITACERQGGAWKQVLGPWIGAVGKNGIALVDEKKEGDAKTPAGLYTLGEAFGSKPLALKMDYKYITAEDKFIDDVNHKDYNTWVQGETDATHYESMLVPSYKMGVIINYNRNPVIPGAGSAIFMHLRKAPNVATAGCVSMDEPHLLSLLNWLNKKHNPSVFIIK